MWSVTGSAGGGAPRSIGGVGAALVAFRGLEGVVKERESPSLNFPLLLPYHSLTSSCCTRDAFVPRSRLRPIPLD